MEREDDRRGEGIQISGLQRNGGQEAYVKDRVKRAVAVMAQVWEMGKRRFRGDWGSRSWLFDRLVWTVFSYGMEV